MRPVAVYRNTHARRRPRAVVVGISEEPCAPMALSKRRTPSSVLLDVPFGVRLQQVMRTTQGREVLCDRGSFGERHGVVEVHRVGYRGRTLCPRPSEPPPGDIRGNGKRHRAPGQSARARVQGGRPRVDFHNTPSGISQKSAPPGVSLRQFARM